MEKALSIQNVLNAKFNTLNFAGEWLKVVGKPELTGSWFIMGNPKNGKTSFAMMLSKYLSTFTKVAYNSIEEGLSVSICECVKRTKMIGSNVVLLNKEPFDELINRLKKRKSPSVVVLDSIQFMGLSFKEYKTLKTAFPDKLFIYISHKDGKNPDGHVAKRIYRDANVIFNVEGFRAFCTSRYGGEGFITISEEKANQYWGLNQ